jgi:hypothetical protein
VNVGRIMKRKRFFAHDFMNDRQCEHSVDTGSCSSIRSYFKFMNLFNDVVASDTGHGVHGNIVDKIIQLHRAV